MDQQAKALKAEIERRIQAATEAARLEAQNQAATVAGLMKILAPKDDHKLERSIKATRTDTGAKVTAGDATTIVTNRSGGRFQNARLQEFGTKSRPASPYFFNTWRGKRRTVRSALTRKFNATFKATR